jgi:hypothetical protein
LCNLQERKALRIYALSVIAMLAVLTAGCGEGTPLEEAEREAGVEEAARKEGSNTATTTPVNPQEERMDASEEEKAEIRAGNVAERERQSREEAEDVIRDYDSGAPVEEVYCQLAKAELDLGEGGANKLMDEWSADHTPAQSVQELQEQGMDAQEAMRQVQGEIDSGPTLPEFLDEKGYDCEDPPSAQERNVNEAGQDVSNIPEESPQQDAARLSCFRAYLESFGEEAGREQQRVVAEANRQGVTPYDIAGC